MKVILRKEDSSTSSLLFIYNTVYYRAKKVSFNLSSLLDIMSVFGKTETATRMSLSRACKSGILETSKPDREVIYSLTPTALNYIKEWNTDAKAFWKRFELRNSPWDVKWSFVHIALEDTTRKNDMNEKLQQIGYIQISPQTWLSPYHQVAIIKSILDELEIKADIVSVHGDFEASAGSLAFTQKTYSLNQLSNQYTEFIQNYKPLLTQIKEDPAIIAEGKALPMLHKLGFAFFGVATLDPMLPRTLLPVWPGDSSAKLMSNLHLFLESAAWDYLRKFD